MARLDEIMSGGATYRDTELLAPLLNAVMAVDVVGSWGAVFELWITEDGSWNEQAALTMRTSRGRWTEIMSGGGHGDGWGTPWAPPASGWDYGHLMVCGITGTTMPIDDDDNLAPLRAVYGFASPQVQSVRVEQDGEPDRTVTPTPCGAWLALLVGPDPANLQPRSADGLVLSGSHAVERAQDWVEE